MWALENFFGGNIVRVPDQTIEGFQYRTYSRIGDEKIATK